MVAISGATISIDMTLPAALAVTRVPSRAATTAAPRAVASAVYQNLKVPTSASAKTSANSSRLAGTK
jgi:hypothetical protein